MKRHLPGVLISLLLVGVWAALAAMKAAGFGTFTSAVLIENAMRFWPPVLWQGTPVYQGQTAAMFATYGFVTAKGSVLAVTVVLLLLWSAIAVRLAGVLRTLAVLDAAWLVAPLAMAWNSVQPFGGASGAVHGLAGAAFVWAARRGERETAAGVLLSVLGGMAAYALAGGQAVALDAGGLAVGAVAGLVLRPRAVAPD